MLDINCPICKSLIELASGGTKITANQANKFDWRHTDHIRVAAYCKKHRDLRVYYVVDKNNFYKPLPDYPILYRIIE